MVAECLPVAFTPDEVLKAILKLSPSSRTSEGMLAEQCEEKGPRRWLRSPRGQSHVIDLPSGC